jgi:hypothetical protein
LWLSTHRTYSVTKIILTQAVGELVEFNELSTNASLKHVPETLSPKTLQLLFFLAYWHFTEVMETLFVNTFLNRSLLEILKEVKDQKKLVSAD